MQSRSGPSIRRSCRSSAPPAAWRGSTAVVTDPIDVSNVVGTSEFRVNAFVEDPYVRFEGSPQVTVTVTMKKK